MANNTYTNKVIINNQTILDLTADTVDAAHLLAGYTAHDASGAPVTGTAAGAKTIASVTPTTLTAYDATATYEVVAVDNTAETVYTRVYVAEFDGVTDNTAPASEYGFTRAAGASAGYESSTSVDAVAPDGSTATAEFVSTSSRACTSDDGGAWCNTYQRTSTEHQVGNPLVPDQFTQWPYEALDMSVTKTLASLVAAKDGNGDTYYIATATDGTVETTTAIGGKETASGRFITSARCISVSYAAAGTVPGYLITYTDGTTETLAARAADIANGGY